MLCIHLKNTNPFFCLAAEEYLLKNLNEDIFMLWQSDKTVVVGKHQNALGEINYPFVRENNITVARRISGGGTVYHDFGNVNFSFIKNVKSPAEISFKLFTEPVREALAKMGITATTSGRNDLLVEGLKISGNAEHVFKNRVLHHGTLLFNSDLEKLGQAIKVVPGKYQSKAVQSNRSKVANISSFLKKDITTAAFIQFLLEVQLNKTGNQNLSLTNSEEAIIQKLAVEKFETWDWRYGYSPKYTFVNRVEINNSTLQIELQVKKGYIEQCVIGGNFFSERDKERLEIAVSNKKHFYDDIATALPRDKEQLIYTFF
jgi:lipoate-protein ligase A